MTLGKVFILTGKDNHAYRLIQGLQSINDNVCFGASIDQTKYDYIFVDHSSDFSGKLNTDNIILFDCEDDPTWSNNGKAYYEYKNMAKAYAKLVYKKYTIREDGLKQIAFPIAQYLAASTIARESKNMYSDKRLPYFIGAPTTFHVTRGKIERVNTNRYPTYYKYGININSLGYDSNHGLSYNQRVDWLTDMSMNNVKYFGHIVFNQNEHCYSIPYQESMFGDVGSFSGPRISYLENLRAMLQCNICLCPTGHDRISYRVYDAMSTASIIILTDIEDRKMLYMPNHYIEVKDGESVSHAINTLDYQSEKSKAESNREHLAVLTPGKICQDFLDQLK